MPHDRAPLPGAFYLDGPEGPLAFRFGSGRSIARRLAPNSEQYSAFGAPKAQDAPYRAGDWIGSVREGGGCNCFVLTVNPHCNGTHTESIGHLTRAREPVIDTGAHLAPFLARLISVAPTPAEDSGETYEPAPQPDDLLVTARSLEAAMAGARPVPGLVIRIRATDDQASAPPFLSHQAMRLVRDWGTERLLVEMPSVDREEDGGLLTCHRIFWNMPAGATDAPPEAFHRRTITELVEAHDDLPDGLYAVQIQLPLIQADALPCDVLLFPPANG